MDAGGPAPSPDGFWRRLLGPFHLVLVAVVVMCLVLGGGLAVRFLFVTSPDQAAVEHAPRITDTAYERAATAVCKQYAVTFGTQTTLGKTPTQREAGAFVDNIANLFDSMVAKLAALPVAPADQADVTRWLAQWGQYDAFGHTYATAIAAGAERDLVLRDSASQGRLRRARNGFAKANHMSACAFN